MILIFEGPDGGGKDFIRRAFEEATSYKNTVVTRFFFSQLVYAKYFKRPEWTDDKRRRALIRTASKFIKEFKPLVVYCYAEVKVLEARIKARGEDVSAQPSPVAVSMAYEEAFDSIGVGDKILYLDTSDDPPMESLINQINKKISYQEKKR